MFYPALALQESCWYLPQGYLNYQIEVRKHSDHFFSFLTSKISTISSLLFALSSSQNQGAKSGFDMKVSGAWLKGYTGKGVVVTILDDGIQPNHPDLEANYVRFCFSSASQSLILLAQIYPQPGSSSQL